MTNQNWKQAVVTVGGGRGFIVEGKDDTRFIITAGHCLPKLPECNPSIPKYERAAYYQLIGHLGAEPAISAECVFVDPVSDVAVLATPDGQEFPTEAEDYEAFVAACPVPLKIGGLQHTYALGAAALDTAWLMSLAGEWFSYSVSSIGGGLMIRDTGGTIRRGMSGSPIVKSDGTAIGVVSISEESGLISPPNPELAAHLPGWITRSLT